MPVTDISLSLNAWRCQGQKPKAEPLKPSNISSSTRIKKLDVLWCFMMFSGYRNLCQFCGRQQIQLLSVPCRGTWWSASARASDWRWPLNQRSGWLVTAVTAVTGSQKIGKPWETQSPKWSSKSGQTWCRQACVPLSACMCIYSHVCWKQHFEVS